MTPVSGGLRSSSAALIASSAASILLQPCGGIVVVRGFPLIDEIVGVGGDRRSQPLVDHLVGFAPPSAPASGRRRVPPPGPRRRHRRAPRTLHHSGLRVCNCRRCNPGRCVMVLDHHPPHAAGEGAGRGLPAAGTRIRVTSSGAAPVAPLMSSNTTAPVIESVSAPVTPPANAKTAMPAANPAVTPATLSSTTAHRYGAHPCVGREQEDVGGRLARATWSTLKIRPSKRSKRPVRPRVNRIFS